MKPDRRRNPRIWDTDWLVLRQLSRLIEEQVGQHVACGANMVDLGCGSMPYATMIRDMGIDYRGADIDKEAPLPIDPMGRVPLPAGSIDAVLSVQVLEHVDDLDSYCAEINRLMHAEGTLFLSTHGTWLYHPHPEDHRRWTRTGLVTDLAKRGLVVEDLFPVVGPLATTTLIRLTGYAYVARKLPVLGAMVSGLLAILMNSRATLEDWLTPRQMRYDNACVYLVRARKAAA